MFLNLTWKLRNRYGQLGVGNADNCNFCSGNLGSFVAGMTGFEPAISALTGQRVRPLHHTPERRLVYHNIVL